MTVPLVDNILAQPEAIRTVTGHHFGEGKRALLEAAAVLRSSKRVVLSGMGASLSACIPLSYDLASHGIFAPVIETSELLYSFAPAIDEHTTLLLVSRSGESVEATKLLSILRDRKATVIGVTNVPGSTLAEQATRAVLINSPADQLVAIQTYAGTVTALLLLGAAFSNGLDTNLRSELDGTVNALSIWIPQCFESSQHWSSFFDQHSPLYLLGRGASLGSVTAGALLFHEVAKAPAIGMGAATFRHGPVEVVNEGFRSILFASNARTENLDASLAEDLAAIKGDVRWIGPEPGGRDVAQLCSWPANIPDRFAPVLEIVPIQIGAYRLAESRGVVPGEFRYAPAITLSETGFGRPGLA